MHIYKGKDIDLNNSGYISLTHDTCFRGEPYITFEISCKYIHNNLKIELDKQIYADLDLAQVDQLINELIKCRDTVKKYYGDK